MSNKADAYLTSGIGPKERRILPMVSPVINENDQLKLGISVIHLSPLSLALRSFTSFQCKVFNTLTTISHVHRYTKL